MFPLVTRTRSALLLHVHSLLERFITQQPWHQASSASSLLRRSRALSSVSLPLARSLSRARSSSAPISSTCLLDRALIHRCPCSLAPRITSGLADQPLSEVTAPAKVSKISYYQSAGFAVIGALLQLRWSYTGAFTIIARPASQADQILVARYRFHPRSA